MKTVIAVFDFLWPIALGCWIGWLIADLRKAKRRISQLEQANSQHPVRCRSTLASFYGHDHRCIHPPHTAVVDGDPEHRCHCGTKWIIRAEEASRG